MSATIIVFPCIGSRAPHADDRESGPQRTRFPSPPISAASLATKFTDHFLPIAQASIDLLEAEPAAFEARCRNMLDIQGMAMIDELCTEIDIVSKQMKVLVDGLEMTRIRLRTAMARLSTASSEGSGERA